MKVKVFIFKNPELAEEHLSTWLETNSVAIHHISQSQSEKNGAFLLILSVFYYDHVKAEESTFSQRDLKMHCL